jgi:hypothetical protein
MLPAETPRLPKWPFLLGDISLLGLAWMIAELSADPFNGPALVWIVVCVLLAAILGAYPFVADYARKYDEALDERQRGLDAISRTVAASAEQISIAANGLHELTDLAQRNLKAAGQLGPGLETRVAELKAALTATRDDGQAALKQELAALRAADSALKNLAKTAADLALADSSLQKQLAAAQELCTRAAELATALTRASPASQTPDEPRRSPTDEDGLPAAAEPARKRAPRRSATPAEATEVPPALAASPALATPDEPRRSPEGEGGPPATPEFPAPASEPAPATVTPETASPASATPDEPRRSPEGEGGPPARKRAPRKPRAEPAEPRQSPPSEGGPPTTDPGLELPAASQASTTPDEPRQNPEAEGGPPAISPAPETPAEPKRPRKSPASATPDEPRRSPEGEDGPASDSDEPARSVEQSRSSDGATRLLVTAYIGIGNRLFIRGEGPGLAWDKGVPLQFVSIGKWRWETPDAAGPVKYKLYKNDAAECTALGAQQVDPGQQQEVTAAF